MLSGVRYSGCLFRQKCNYGCRRKCIFGKHHASLLRKRQESAFSLKRIMCATAASKASCCLLTSTHAKSGGHKEQRGRKGGRPDKPKWRGQNASRGPWVVE